MPRSALLETGERRAGTAPSGALRLSCRIPAWNPTRSHEPVPPTTTRIPGRRIRTGAEGTRRFGLLLTCVQAWPRRIGASVVVTIGHMHARRAHAYGEIGQRRAATEGGVQGKTGGGSEEDMQGRFRERQAGSVEDRQGRLWPALTASSFCSRAAISSCSRRPPGTTRSRSGRLAGGPVPTRSTGPLAGPRSEEGAGTSP